MNSSLVHLFLQKIAALVIFTVLNVFICFSTAGLVLLQLLASGTNRYCALALSIVVAVGSYAYLIFNHKIRNFIK